MRALVGLAILAIVAGSAGSAGATPGDRRGGSARADRREEIKQRIRALRAAELQAELQLGEKDLARLLPVLSKWDDVTDKLIVVRVDLHRRLARAEHISDAKAVDKLIDEAIANQKAFWDLEDKRLAELRKILSPAQVAKLLIVLPEFERQIQSRLRRAITRQRDAPDDDSDDDPEPDRRPRRSHR